MKEHINVLICDKFDEEGVKRLQKHKNITVFYNQGYSRTETIELLPQIHGVILRSATKFNKELFKYSKKLKIIIRAGVGVDNIDLLEASQRGIIVENAPAGNTFSTAEQALALMFACARKTPQASASMKSGKWEKSKFKGMELRGKTLGIVGLGRIGREMMKRAHGLKMNVIGYDPYIQKTMSSHFDIDLVTPEEILKNSDFITVHTPLTEQTRDFINHDNLKLLKKGVVLINAARGGIYNEDALIEGLKSGKIGSVGLDVFTKEPLDPKSPLLGFDNCILTPHLGASTKDAEYAVAMETVDQIIDYFENGIAPNALNFPSIDAESMGLIRPYFLGASKVAFFLAHLLEDIASFNISYYGKISDYPTDVIRTAVQYGILSYANADVNIVNAPVIAKKGNLKISETKSQKTPKHLPFSSLVSLEGKDSQNNKVEIFFTEFKQQAKVVFMDDLALEFDPKGILLFIKNKDVPGVVGSIGQSLSEFKINIVDLALKRTERTELKEAICVISLEKKLSPENLKKLRKLGNIKEVRQINLQELA